MIMYRVEFLDRPSEVDEDGWIEHDVKYYRESAESLIERSSFPPERFRITEIDVAQTVLVYHTGAEQLDKIFEGDDKVERATRRAQGYNQVVGDDFPTYRKCVVRV